MSQENLEAFNALLTRSAAWRFTALGRRIRRPSGTCARPSCCASRNAPMLSRNPMSAKVLDLIAAGPGAAPAQ